MLEELVGDTEILNAVEVSAELFLRAAPVDLLEVASNCLFEAQLCVLKGELTF